MDLLAPRAQRVILADGAMGTRLHPEQSTDAIIVHHPGATYFNAR